MAFPAMLLGAQSDALPSPGVSVVRILCSLPAILSLLLAALVALRSP